MNMSNINLATEWFEVLQTTERSQTAVMRLDPGQSTGEHAESHDKSEQLLLLLEGRLMAEIGGKKFAMDVCDLLNLAPRGEPKFYKPTEPKPGTVNRHSSH